MHRKAWQISEGLEFVDIDSSPSSIFGSLLRPCHSAILYAPAIYDTDKNESRRRRQALLQKRAEKEVDEAGNVKKLLLEWDPSARDDFDDAITIGSDKSTMRKPDAK